MRDRTADLLDANQTLSQLSYGPNSEFIMTQKRAYYTLIAPARKGFREVMIRILMLF